MKVSKKILFFIVIFLVIGTSFVIAACAPQAPESSGDDSGTAIESISFSPSSDCGTCHTAEEASRSDTSCLAGIHPVRNCNECHVVTSDLEKVHEDATSDSRMPTRLKSTSIDEAYCISCHDLGSLKEATAGTTILTDSNGTTVNPHDLPTVADHDSIQCWSCHGGHKALQDFNDACLKCHHQNVYECGTCHE